MRLGAILALALTGCQAGSGRPLNAAEATDASNAFLAAHLPQVPLHRLRIEAREAGDSWVVTYNPPADSTGGPIIIDVNKRTGAITNSTMEQ